MSKIFPELYFYFKIRTELQNVQLTDFIKMLLFSK